MQIGNLVGLNDFKLFHTHTHRAQKKAYRYVLLFCVSTVPDSLCHCHLAICQDHATALVMGQAKGSSYTSGDPPTPPLSTTTSAGMESPTCIVDQHTTCHQNDSGYPMLTIDLCHGSHGGMPFWWIQKTNGVNSSASVIVYTNQVVGGFHSQEQMQVCIILSVQRFSPPAGCSVNLIVFLVHIQESKLLMPKQNPWYQLVVLFFFLQCLRKTLLTIKISHSIRPTTKFSHTAVSHEP